MKQVIDPTSYDQTVQNPNCTVFLAGSIEEGRAENWQPAVIDAIEGNVTIYNPRRPNWDNSIEQRARNAEFNKQANWELNALKAAKVIFMYLDPNTKSPISLMEMGIYANSGKLIVCCPDGFWKKGNVEVLSHRNNFPLFNDLSSAVSALKSRLSSFGK